MSWSILRYIHKYYAAGEQLCHTDIEGVGIGGYICYDLRFPEIFSAARDENEAVIVIANWPEERVSQWETLLRARAVENQCYVMGVNRTGYGDGKNYAPEKAFHSHGIEKTICMLKCINNRVSKTDEYFKHSLEKSDQNTEKSPLYREKQ